jgi:hypothetical protein
MRLRDRASSYSGLPAHRPRRVQSMCSVARHPAPTMVSPRCGPARQAAAGWTLLVGLFGACAPEEELPLPPVVWEGESVRVRMDDPGIEVCGGSFEALDRHAELVREALLLEGDGVVEYSIGDEELVDERCSRSDASPAACATFPAGNVFTSIPFVPHELVHAVRIQDPNIGFLSSAFEEGLATVFGSDPPTDDTIALDTLGILEEPLVTGPEEYYRAGHAMAILLNQHGIDSFRRFDVLARTTAEDRAFVQEFGETKEEFAVEAESAPHCEQSQWWVPLLECDGEPAVANPETGMLTLSGNVDCSAPDVQGPELGRMWTSRHFRLDEPTSTISYEFTMPEDATLEIVGCSSSCPQRFAYIGRSHEVGSIANGLPGLEPGTYFLRMSRPIDSGSDGDGWFELSMK